MVVVDVTTLKIAKKLRGLHITPLKIRQDALGKVNRMKEISRRE